MVKYPHIGTLVTPAEPTWAKGKATTSPSTEEIIDCEVQPDNSNFVVTINGKTVTSRYRVYVPNGYDTTLSAMVFRFGGNDYDILQAFQFQYGVKMKVG